MSRTLRAVWRIARSLVVPVFMLSVVACGGGSSGATSPTAPTPASPSVNIAGAWGGTAKDSSGPGRMTWQLSQSGSAISGTMTMSDDVTQITGQGTVSGTLAGSTLQFSIAIPAGGFSGGDNACSLSVSGSASATVSTLSGTFTGSNTCGVSVTGGELTMSKQ
jgi:hypothetical protein